MKKSKQLRDSGPSGKPRPITPRQFDLQYVYTLDRDSPAEFEAISQLRPLKRWIERNGLDEFRVRLGGTISVYRSRYKDRTYNTLARQDFSVPPIAPARSSKKKPASSELPYFKRISETCEALKTALDSLQVAAERLRFVDVTHMERMLTVARSFPVNPISTNPWDQLSETIHCVGAMMLALQLGTGVLTGPRTRSRPRAGYVWPALELAELWEEFSGAPIKTPRQAVLGKNGHKEFAQHSSQFVHLGLKMIDPDVSESEVVTAIRNALALQKEIGDISIKEAISKILSSE